MTSHNAGINNTENRTAELETALRWYVENDDTQEGGAWEEENKFWLDGKRRAEKLLVDTSKGKTCEQ